MKSVSLRLLLVIPFTLQLSVAVGVTGYWSWRNGQQAVQDLAGQLREEVSDRIGQHLDSYLAVPQQLVGSNQESMEIGLLDIQDRQQLQLAFWQQVRSHEIGYLLLGLETGEYLAVGHFWGDKRITLNSIPHARPDGGELYSWKLGQQGQRAEAASALGPFNPQLEGWYEKAVQQNRRVWSPVYNWLVEPYSLSIAVSQPLYERSPDGRSRLVGVLAAEQQLSAISDFLADLEVSASGQTFIMEPSGLLIGSSTSQPPFVVEQGVPRRLRASDSDDVLIRSTARFLEQTFPELSSIITPQQLTFELDDERHFVQVMPWQDELGLDWLVVVTMAEADVMGQIQANARQTLLLCLIALMVATGLGIYSSHWITQPLLRFSDAAESIAQRTSVGPGKPAWSTVALNPTQLRDHPSYRFHELERLSQSFRHMIQQLQSSFEQLTYSANHDALTGLPNRLALGQLLQQRMDARQPFALMFLDLDYFKLVNDSFGHGVGDLLLIAVAERLKQNLTPADTVARFGGDEFVLLLAGDPDSAIDDRATKIAQTLIQQLQRPFFLAEREVFVGISVGLVISNQPGLEEMNAQEALRNADTALYAAKAHGKGRYALFDSAMHRSTVQRLQLETDLRQALQQETLTLHYQPIVHTQSGKIGGFEALLRWWNPQKGMYISPEEFIPIAEETGLILPLTDWVARRACEQLKLWQAEFSGSEDWVMHVNVASQQFLQTDWVKTLVEMLQETKVSPHCLNLEVTERTLLQHSNLTQLRLQQLTDAGIQVSIDDFGTGYSSLSYLQQFAINSLKIDRTFIQQLDQESPRSDVIVRAIAAMAHMLGLKMVAEGVETEAQRKALLLLGCQQCQGYYFSKPGTTEEIELLLEQQQLEQPFLQAS